MKTTIKKEMRTCFGLRPRSSTISFVDITPITEQQHKDEVCIQNILHKHKKTGIIQHLNSHQGTYMDYSNSIDYHAAQNIIADANSLFETVPAHIRKDMKNNPETFVDFMQNPDNRKKIEAYGLDSSHLPATPPP